MTSSSSSYAHRFPARVAATIQFPIVQSHELPTHQMSINGINNSISSNLPSSLGSAVRNDVSRTNGDRTGASERIAPPPANTANRTALRPQTPIAGTTANASVPLEAPAGTDPSLWSVLTADERSFFAKSASMGPLTYGRMKAATNAAPPAARGVRIDVRA